MLITYIEGLLCVLTAAEASFLTTGNKDEPILRLGARGQDGLPVRHGHRRDALRGDLLGHLHDGIGRNGGRNVRLGLVEPSLDTVGQRHLLLRHGKGREEGDKRCETHLDGCDAWKGLAENQGKRLNNVYEYPQ